MGYKNYQSSFEEQAKWNMDQEVLKMVIDIKMSFLTNLKNWKLEDAYFDLLLFYSEVKAKFSEEQKEELDQLFSELNKKRNEFNKSSTAQKKMMISEYFPLFSDLYSELNTVCKVNGLWFRESAYDNESTML